MKRGISWFLNLHENGQLNLDPPYQRRSVWTLKDRRYFLDSIFRNYPSPAIFLHKEIDEGLGKMAYHVVDGKQRLETILLFTQNNIAIDKEYGDARLNAKKWKSVEKEPDLKARFYEYLLPVEFIDSNDSTVINEVFDRLNRTSRKLERQELRHAKYDGWFIRTSEEEAEKEEWERLGVVTKARMRRMKDVQCISELLIVLLQNHIVGYDQDTLDDIYAEYDSPHETLPDFDESDFKRKLESTKDYIGKTEAHNSAVTRYARGMGNFYSLWAFAVLNQDRLETPGITAERYAGFMEKVTTLSKERDINTFLREYQGGSYIEAYDYLKNSLKTGSDQPQREARNRILESILLSHPLEEEPLMQTTGKNTFSLPDRWTGTKKNDNGEHILKLIMGKADNTKEKESPKKGETS